MLDAVEVGNKLIAHGLMSQMGGTHAGEAVHLPNEMKMNLILPEIDKKIYLTGPEILYKLVTALSEMPSCYELSMQLKGIYILIM